MKKNMILISTFLLMSSCTHNTQQIEQTSMKQNGFVLFLDTSRSNTGDEIFQSPIKEQDKQNLLQVLEYYNEPYKIINQEVYVNSALAENLELVRNFSNKMRDDEWLKNHK